MFETIEVTTPQVACEGVGGALGHPRVYLHFDSEPDSTIVCPYCSRTFVLKAPTPNIAKAS